MKKIQQMRASNTSDVSTMEEEEFNPRASLKHEDLEEDRRLIKKKIKQKIQKHRQLDNSARSDPDYYDPENLRNDSFDDGFEEDDDDRIDEEHVFRAVKAAHEQDEELIGGRDGQEALEAALSSPPTAWWAMRKQWQKRRNSLGFGGKGGGGRRGGRRNGRHGYSKHCRPYFEPSNGSSLQTHQHRFRSRRPPRHVDRSTEHGLHRPILSSKFQRHRPPRPKSKETRQKETIESSAPHALRVQGGGSKTKIATNCLHCCCHVWGVFIHVLFGTEEIIALCHGGQSHEFVGLFGGGENDGE